MTAKRQQLDSNSLTPAYPDAILESGTVRPGTLCGRVDSSRAPRGKRLVIRSLTTKYRSARAKPITGATAVILTEAGSVAEEETRSLLPLGANRPSQQPTCVNPRGLVREGAGAVCSKLMSRELLRSTLYFKLCSLCVLCGLDFQGFWVSLVARSQ